MFYKEPYVQEDARKEHIKISLDAAKSSDT